ncbi:MAG: tRNA epoxyqueuosine(34) reductase QueG [Terriglobia bacterium]|jgi:epoxyqueuosine reductase
MGWASIIKRRALEAGFDLVGIAPPAARKDSEFLSQWVKKGFGGEMRYLADPRREDPHRVLPSVKSVISVGLIYNTPHPYSTQVGGPSEGERNSAAPPAATREVRPRAWISRYAWGRDYHDVLRGKLEQLRATGEELAPGVETRVYVDTGPILERAFARLSGIGWMGKNTCLINERKGSWFFLGVILTNLELELDLPAPDRCGTCTLCLEACPTGALVEPYVMDASRCIAYFNIELKGSIPEQFRAAMGSNLFGCDICQDVCPWNSPQRAAVSSLPEFQPLSLPQATSREPVSGAETGIENEASLFDPSLQALAAFTEEDFRRLFARSPLKRAKYIGWLRNLCVVMGNSVDCQFTPWLESAAGRSDPVVREHAAWALHRLRKNL